MSETHAIEKQAIIVLTEYLQNAGRTVEKSERKTFDLIVDGIPTEVKGKQLPWGKLDFISLTKKQRAALQNGENFLLFIVCNLKGPSEPEIIEIKTEMLNNAKFVVEPTHYIYGSELKRITGRIS